MRKNIKNYGFIVGVVLALGACSNDTKESMGLSNTAPDEFAIVTRAPLSVPPDYTLRPPKPGVQRPMEISTTDQARQTVFGETTKTAPKTTEMAPQSSNVLLVKTGAEQADPNIRDVVDMETASGAEDNRTTAENLMFWDDSVESQGTPIDPTDEYDRLKEEGVIAVQKRNEEIPAP